jgi:hypothetical protein
LARSRDLVLAELGEAAKAMPAPPLSIVVFGSFARGDAGVMEVDERVIGSRPRSLRPVWRDITREGIAIFG